MGIHVRLSLTGGLFVWSALSGVGETEKRDSLAMIQRKQVRDSYKIDGSGCGDCCLSFWCPCCGILQQHNEIEEREKLVNKNGYQPQPGMHM